MSEKAIGIDLGTRNALSAYMNEKGAVVPIQNRWGGRVTPSVVGWDNGWVVGEDAVRLGFSGTEHVWWDLKRKVGSPFSVEIGGRTYRAQDLLVPLIGAIREDAEVALGGFVSSCVLTVPACFTLAQREAMIRSARAAGLEKTRIVAEPTAAALAFGGEGRFLVLDFGAGTVDISVVESEGGVWQVLESVGTESVGGYEFDVALADWLREGLLLDPLPEHDPRWRVLVQEAEKIKISLSDCWSYNWMPPPVGNWKPVAMNIYREDLERLMRFSIRRLVHTVKRLWKRYDPEKLLLVGGSSRIPMLAEILELEVAHPERLCLSAEDSVVRGAALYTEAGKERLLLDALSGDLMALWEGRSTKVISSEANLPIRAEVDLRSTQSGRSTLELLQSQNELRRSSVSLASIDLDVVEGERLQLSCQLSASGRLAAAVSRETGETFDIPLALAEESERRDPELENSRRLRELKLALAGLEATLSDRQQNHLHTLVRKAESAPSDPEIMGLLEGLVRDLERAVS